MEALFAQLLRRNFRCGRMLCSRPLVGTGAMPCAFLSAYRQ